MSPVVTRNGSVTWAEPNHHRRYSGVVATAEVVTRNRIWPCADMWIVMSATGSRDTRPECIEGFLRACLTFIVRLDEPSAVVAGLRTSAVLLPHDGSHHGIAIELTVCGARALFATPSGALTASVADLNDLLGRKAASASRPACCQRLVGASIRDPRPGSSFVVGSRQGTGSGGCPRLGRPHHVAVTGRAPSRWRIRSAGAGGTSPRCSVVRWACRRVSSCGSSASSVRVALFARRHAPP